MNDSNISEEGSLPGATVLKADFVSDLCALASAELAARGIPPWEKRKNPSQLDPVFQLLTVEHRLIPKRPRRTVWSDVLSARSPDEWLDAAKLIAVDSESGNDLNHYLSTGVSRAEPDMQLNDWGIAHFHLGARRAGQEFSERTGPLLFVMAVAETLHMIDIRSHRSFADLELFEIVHRNWPALIEESKAPNVLSADQFTDEQRSLLRKRGLVTMTVTKDGTAYLPHGMGQVASRLNSTVVMRADHLAMRARAFQEWCETNLDKIVNAAAEVGIKLAGPEVVFTLVEIGEILVAHAPAGPVWLSNSSAGVRLSDGPITAGARTGT